MNATTSGSGQPSTSKTSVGIFLGILHHKVPKDITYFGGRFTLGSGSFLMHAGKNRPDPKVVLVVQSCSESNLQQTRYIARETISTGLEDWGDEALSEGSIHQTAGSSFSHFSYKYRDLYMSVANSLCGTCDMFTILTAQEVIPYLHGDTCPLPPGLPFSYLERDLLSRIAFVSAGTINTYKPEDIPNISGHMIHVGFSRSGTLQASGMQVTKWQGIGDYEISQIDGLPERFPKVIALPAWRIELAYGEPWDVLLGRAWILFVWLIVDNYHFNIYLCLRPTWLTWSIEPWACDIIHCNNISFYPLGKACLSYCTLIYNVVQYSHLGSVRSPLAL